MLLPAVAGPQSLADKQLSAQKALETAVNTQLSAIKVATTTKVISLTQALALWKRARRDRCARQTDMGLDRSSSSSSSYCSGQCKRRCCLPACLSAWSIA